MPRYSAILFLLFYFLVTLCFAQDDKEGRLKAEILKYGQAEVIIPWPGEKAMDKITKYLSVSSVRDKKIYVTLSPKQAEWFLEQGFDYNIAVNESSKGVVTASSVKQAMEWESYPTYTQYDSIMRKFMADYPALCRLDTIGTSINGKLVMALKISDNAAFSEPEPAVFYSSTIHGDELAGFVLMLRLADHLLKNYNTDARIKNLVDNLEIWINPLANPDGTYRSGDVISSPVRANANGIDLNRNFPDPFDPGNIPDKETIDMISFMRRHRFVLSANFHAGEEVVNFPWDRWLSKYHADHDWFYYISRKYADTVHFYSVPAYMSSFDNGVVRGCEWYVIYGGRQDFVTWELQGREVTIELDYTRQTPAAQLGLLWLYNGQSFIGYIENALYGIYGMVSDAETSLPVPARIFITGHDKDSSHVYSDTLTGQFTRFLSPGSWDLTFSAMGYRDTVVTGVVVSTDQRTNLQVAMTPLPNNIDTTPPQKPFLYPNPSSDFILCRLPEVITGNVRIKIINSTGVRVADFITSGNPVTIDVRRFSPGAYLAVFKSSVSGISYSARFIVAPGRH